MKKCECGSCNESSVAVLEKDTCGGGRSDCGHNDCGHGHERNSNEITSTKQDVIAIIISVAVCAAAFLVPNILIKNILMLASVVIAGAPIFWQGLKNIFKLDLDELALLTIAVTAAAIIGELPEALLVTVLFRVGELLEDIAVARSRREVEAITGVLPDNANLLLADGTTQPVSAKDLESGDRIKIKSGEKVPVDCKILDGSSSVDSSSLTGESAPREVEAGDVLHSGMVNLGGVLTCEAVNTFDNSTASKIVQMVKDSAAKKGETEKMISRFARVYTPIIIISAILVAVLPPLFGFGTFSMWIGRSLVFLVASCPCALVIATPLAFFAGIGGASKQGILIKGSKFMEALAKTKAVVFDKTGTLTTGKLAVDEVFAAPGFDRGEVLALAAACESESNHPIAKAIAACNSGSFPLAESCEEITAYGMRATVNGDIILCGSKRLIDKFGADIKDLPEANVYVAKNGTVIGGISVFDAPREDAAQMAKALNRLGASRIVMLTGDGKTAAEKTAALVGINDVYAELLPQDKVESFIKIRAGTTGGTALFVGDGINDSPVIAAADAGVAMGIASDAAIEAADVVLLSDRLSSLPQAISIAKRTSKLAKTNIAFALTIKMAVLALAFFGYAGMWLAVFADVGVSIISVINATRALRFK